MYGVGITNNGFIGFHTNGIASIIGHFLILYGTRTKKCGSGHSAVIHYVLIEYPTGTIMRKVIESIETIIYISIYLSRSEEHTSELQSRPHLVCRLLLEKKKKKIKSSINHLYC